MSSLYGRVRLGNAERSQWRVANRSFTLVEMLVTIAVTLILVSLLLPALTSGIDASRQVTCANNLRAQTIATQQYVQDFRNYLPSWDDNSSVSWSDQLYTPAERMRLYIPEGIETFWCNSCDPSCQTGRGTAGSWAWLNLGRTQYAVNQFAAFTDRNNHWRNISTLKNPSSLVWSLCTNNGYWIYIQRGIQPVDYWNNWLTGPDYLSTTLNLVSDLRHYQYAGSNYSYIDGHVKGQYGLPELKNWVPGRTVN